MVGKNPVGWWYAVLGVWNERREETKRGRRQEARKRKKARKERHEGRQKVKSVAKRACGHMSLSLR